MEHLLYPWVYCITLAAQFWAMYHALFSWRKGLVAIITWHSIVISILTAQWLIISHIAEAIHIPVMGHVLAFLYIVVVTVSVTKLTDRYILK